MKTFLFLLGLAFGVVGGFAGGIFIYPFLFPPPEAAEQVPDTVSRAPIATGIFTHANPSDPIHWGKGSVELLQDRGGERLVHLKPDFQVGPGPRLHVYLSNRADIASSSDFDVATATDLGLLRSFRGSHVYSIPAGVDIDSVRSVVIWCKQFDVLISPAKLQRSSGFMPTPPLPGEG